MSILEPRLVEVELSGVRKPVDNGHGGVALEAPRPVVQAEVVLELSQEALRLLARQRD
ncbi:MAG TPA: hypothetical protein VGR12_01115 [Solirubrobacteraceae bacterium]|nr:hypothetical protein [Solirubrobacteraceae bacterium]